MIRDLLNAEPDRALWSSIKCREIAKAIPRLDRTQRVRGLEVEIVGVTHSGNLIEVFVRAWQSGQQIGFGADGSVDIERLRIANPAILVPDAAGTIFSSWIDEDGIARERRYREDALEALLHDIQHAVRVKKQKVVGSRSIVSGRVGRTTLTVRPNAGTGTAPIDGGLTRSGDVAFSTLMNGTGTSESDTFASSRLRLDASTTTDQFATHTRNGAGFDTSSIGDTDTVSSATASIVSDAKDSNLGANSVGVVSFAPASESDFVLADYEIAKYGSTEFAPRITTAAWVADSATLNDFDLNASGLAYLNRSGNTFFGFRFGWDIDASFTGTWLASSRTSFNFFLADQAGTTQDPILVVEHSAKRTRRPRPIDQQMGDAEDEGHFNELDVRNWWREAVLA